MWDGSRSGQVSEPYINDWVRSHAAADNGALDAKKNVLPTSWLMKVKESLEGELELILAMFTQEEAFSANQFQEEKKEFERINVDYVAVCGSSGTGDITRDIPMKPGIYGILWGGLAVLSWFVQILVFRIEIPLLLSILFSGLFSLALMGVGHIIGRSFRRANDKNERQALGMILVILTLIALMVLYGYMWRSSVSPREVFTIFGAGAVTFFLFVGIVYAAYISGDPNPMGTRLGKRRVELLTELDQIHGNRIKNMDTKNHSINRFEKEAKEMVQEYRHAYERQKRSSITWEAFPPLSKEFICKITDSSFKNWENERKTYLVSVEIGT